MIPSRHTHCFLILLAVLIVLPVIATAQTSGSLSSRLSTRFLARGEQALLEVVYTAGQPTSFSAGQPSAFPEVPRIANVEIMDVGRGAETRLVLGRSVEYVFKYIISSYTVGSHTIPPVELVVGGLKHRTQPLEFTVFNPDDLQWSEAVAGQLRFRYASTFRVLNSTPYEGETIPIEVKVFVPKSLEVDDWGIPDFERDGVTAWRFQPSALRGQINLLGQPYLSVAYPSTLTPIRPGAVGIGPAKLRLMTTQVVMDGFLRPVAVETHLQIPKLELNAKPLPPGAPEGFENAVGDFGLSVTSQVTDVQEGDPILLDIFVSGSGNLDTLRPPKPVNSDGWKLYEATPESRGDERREFSGVSVFKQFMRPLELKSEIPSFRLVYFNPAESAYKTLLSEPIPLNMTPAAARMAEVTSPPPAVSLPVERMTDILGLMQPASLTIPAGLAIPSWAGHAVGGLLALLLILKALWMRLRPLLRRNPEREIRVAALRGVESIPAGDDAGFLMASGAFIERFAGANTPPDLQAVLAERDALCFRADKPSSGVLDPQRRSSILRLLRSTIPAVIAVLGLGVAVTVARATDVPEVPAPAVSAPAEDLAGQAREAYNAARFSDAISLWLQAGPYDTLAADTLYNIGIASYRAGSVGHAALYFRRALQRDPGHQEARQNLRFIERKHGSITIHRPEYQYALARLPLSAWRGIFWTGVWSCVIALLVFPATRNGSRLRVAAVAALVLGPMVGAFGGLGWRYFPDDAEFAPIENQAVIIAVDAVLHADASRTSPEVIDAPPGSLCEIIHKSGRWAYISFATKTRGWIPIEAIEMIVPQSPPGPPKIRKPKVDSKSA